MEELKRQALKDGLTGLYNHRYFHERLSEEVERSDRTGDSVSVILADMDNFKQINDRYGHLTGDRALIHFAEICRESTRSCDTVARIGGDEFSVLLPEADITQAERVADRIARTLSGKPLTVEEGKHSGDPVPLSFSCGISTYPDEADTARDLVRAADQCLFRAKRANTALRRSPIRRSGL